MDFEQMTNEGLLLLYGAVREALEDDDRNDRDGKQKVYDVREFSDWRRWSDGIAAVLDGRNISYPRVPW